MEAGEQALAQPLPATVSASCIGGHSLAIAGASTMQPNSCRTLKSLNISRQMPRCSSPASVTAIRKVEGWYARLRATLPFTCSWPDQGPCLAVWRMPCCSSPASVTAIRKVEGWYAQLRATPPFTCSCPVQGPCLRCMEASQQALAQPLPATVSASFIGSHRLAIALASTLQPNSCRPLKSLTISSQMPRCSSPASVTAIRKVEGWYARLRATLPFTCSCPVQGSCLRCMEAS